MSSQPIPEHSLEAADVFSQFIYWCSMVWNNIQVGHDHVAPGPVPSWLPWKINPVLGQNQEMHTWYKMQSPESVAAPFFYNPLSLHLQSRHCVFPMTVKTLSCVKSMWGIHKGTLYSSKNSMCLLEKVSYWEELHENYSLLEKDTHCVAKNRIRKTRESEKEDKRNTTIIHQLFIRQDEKIRLLINIWSRD